MLELAENPVWSDFQRNKACAKVTFQQMEKRFPRLNQADCLPLTGYCPMVRELDRNLYQEEEK